MRVALDAMGGDHAPAEPVAGAVLAARELGVSVTLVGPQDVVAAELARQKPGTLPIDVVDAPDVIGMADHPVQAIRHRPGASMNVAMRLVKDGAADGFVSAGNTGAAVVAGLFGLGRVAGVERPALATIFPTVTGQCLILDVGANVDCRPNHLLQFAVMGEKYARLVLEMDKPRVGLLSNGEEDTKGNVVVQEAHQLIRTANLHFIGNVEGKDVPRGLADVVVCDGFVGNVAVKLAEGIGELAFSLLREELSASPITMLAALLLRSGLRRIKHRVDYQEYGGAPLLGVNGVVIIAHGRSRARAIRNAIRVAGQTATSRLHEALLVNMPRSEENPAQVSS